MCTVPLADEYTDEQREEISNFLTDGGCIDTEDGGYFIKSTHATNGGGNLRAKDLEGVVSCLQRLHAEMGFFIERAFIQHSLKNKKELKVVCMAGRAKYIAAFGRKRRSYRNMADNLFQFAEEAILTLKKECPCAVLDGIARSFRCLLNCYMM